MYSLPAVHWHPSAPHAPFEATHYLQEDSLPTSSQPRALALSSQPSESQLSLGATMPEGPGWATPPQRLPSGQVQVCSCRHATWI